MDKLKINLIPPEIKEIVRKDAKRILINKVSIGLLGLLIFLTAVILAVVVYQKASLNKVNSSIEQTKAQINKNVDKEAILKLLKNRLDTINQFTENRYKQGEVFKLISSLFPPGITMDSLEIEKTSKVAISGSTEGTTSMQNFFNNLTDPKMNEGKIASVSIESLSLSQKGGIRFDLKVNLSEGVIK